MICLLKCYQLFSICYFREYTTGRVSRENLDKYGNYIQSRVFHIIIPDRVTSKDKGVDNRSKLYIGKQKVVSNSSTTFSKPKNN